MRLSVQTDYALRTLMFLAVKDGHHSIAEIAHAYGISKNHLMKVAQRLAAEGFVEGVRGRSGGLKLARPANALNVGSIMRAMEESLPWPKVRHFLAQFQLAGNAFDCEQTLNLLLESVNGFVPVSEGIDDLVWQARQAEVIGAARTTGKAAQSLPTPNGSLVDMDSGRRA